ncbi:MAG: DUF1549 domain-containing protein [Planctomycetia bacterium]|nr:DUF1549 domain-containing protein [Planctomycetia bacterium]
MSRQVRPLAAVGCAILCFPLSVFAADGATAREAAARLDAALAAQWQSQGVDPAGACDDAAFLRRAWLDPAGRVPPFLAARDFLASRDENKREKLVDTLLASDEFADYWGRVLTEMLTQQRPVRHETHDGRVLQKYLRDALAENKSYQAIARELIAGQGLSESSGPANFILRYDAQPNQLTGAVSKLFLGVSLQCAECHNHPFERWTQDDYRGMAAFFARVRRLDDNNAADYLRAVVETRRGEFEIDDPQAKKVEGEEPKKLKIAPRLLDGTSPQHDLSRREALAQWATSAENPYFARNIVNRVWAQVFGRGLVEPLESLGAESPGPHAAVLDVLASDFSAGGFDLKQLLRTILLSRAYHLDSAAPADGGAEQALAQVSSFARFPVRPLSVDQLYESIVQSTGYSGRDEAAEADAEEMGDYGAAYTDWPGTAAVRRRRTWSLRSWPRSRGGRRTRKRRPCWTLSRQARATAGWKTCGGRS